MTTAKNKPVDTIRDGALKVTIWRNFGDNGTFYTSELSRTYTDENGAFKDSHSLSGTDDLVAARLLHQAYDRKAQLRAADKLAQNQQAPATQEQAA